MRIPYLDAAAGMNPDFSISAKPTLVIINPGPQGNSTVTITSQQGFAGTVNVTAGASVPHGLYCQVTRTSLIVRADGSNSTVLHCDGNPGTFTETVVSNASIASVIVSHLVSVTYVVADFSISANPPSITLQTGHQASTTVTISSQQAFTQNIYLNLTLPPGVNGSITPSILSGPGTATLKVNSTAAGIYNLTIVAASGSISHKQWLQVTVTGLPGPSEPTFGLPPLIFYAALGSVVFIIPAGLITWFRHVKRPRKG